MKIGAITIGQTPRSDILSEIKEEIGLDIEIEERGALDGLSIEAVKSFYPRSNDYILITKMKDGQEVKIAERYIIERLSKCVTELEDSSVDFIILLCTGEFPGLISRVPILKPDILMKNLIKSIFQKGTMAVVAPSPDQKLLMENKWKDVNMSVVFESISPFIDQNDVIEKVAQKISDSSVDLVILDCLGFNRKIKAIFKNFIKKPVVLPRTFLGKLTKELIEN